MKRAKNAEAEAVAIFDEDLAANRAMGEHGASLIPTFHPAYLLRSPERKREVWEDMKKVRALLRDEGTDARIFVPTAVGSAKEV